MTEAQLQAAVIELARTLGWLVYHTRDSRGSAAGFPDLCMVHPKHDLIFAELKNATRRVTPEQEEWLDALGYYAEAFVWRPADWLDGSIERALR